MGRFFCAKGLLRPVAGFDAFFVGIIGQHELHAEPAPALRLAGDDGVIGHGAVDTRAALFEHAVDALFEAPLHPYTVGLIGATPVPGAARAERLADIPGMVPPLNALPQGCAFAPRCKRVMERCRHEQPALTRPAPDRLVACFAVEQV